MESFLAMATGRLMTALASCQFSGTPSRRSMLRNTQLASRPTPIQRMHSVVEITKNLKLDKPIG